MSSSYTATIGLEVHAELKTKSKMFCGCKNDPHDGKPNSFVCPVCLAHPGTLPTPNEEAIKMVLLFGQAVNAKPATYSEFDRKNYFYPDIPKAYQISQYKFPFLSEGELAGVNLTRVHLEEDTARSQHDHDGVSLVDFNRAGVPLMELVTEPVIHDAGTAGKFAKELQLLLRTLDISNANMEKGEMRVEANISVSTTDELGTKVEVKNLNSFKSVEGAIAYEIERQITVLESGKELSQETRGWDEVKLKTYTQRSKESAKDYRYFPDPDIPNMFIPEKESFSSSRINEKMVILPQEKRLKYKDIGLPEEQIEIIIGYKPADIFYQELLNLSDNTSNEVLKLSANYLTSDLLSIIDTESIEKIPVAVVTFLKLMTMVNKSEINSRVAKDLLAEMCLSDIDPEIVAKERGLLQSFDPNALTPIVEQIIKDNPVAVEEYKNGKENALQFLVGQGMKATRGSANPGLLKDLLKQYLG